jgi:uncharacterized coiled-coil protein SlyX
LNNREQVNRLLHDAVRAHVGAHRFASERLAAVTAELGREMERAAELTNAVLRLRSDLDAATAERDAERERAAWSLRTADTRWRQLDAVRERVSVQLLSIDTLARNVAEYPDRIPLLIETIESLYARVQDGSIAALPTTTAARPPEARGE